MITPLGKKKKTQNLPPTSTSHIAIALEAIEQDHWKEMVGSHSSDLAKKIIATREIVLHQLKTLSTNNHPCIIAFIQKKLKEYLNRFSLVNPSLEKLILLKELFLLIDQTDPYTQRIQAKQENIGKNIDLIWFVGKLMQSRTQPDILPTDETKVSKKLLAFAEAHYHLFKPKLTKGLLAIGIEKLLMHVLVKWRARTYAPYTITLTQEESDLERTLINKINTTKYTTEENVQRIQNIFKIITSPENYSLIFNVAAENPIISAFCSTNALKEHWGKQLKFTYFENYDNFQPDPQENLNVFHQLQNINCRHRILYNKHKNNHYYRKTLNTTNPVSLYDTFIEDCNYCNMFPKLRAKHQLNTSNLFRTVSLLRKFGTIGNLASMMESFYGIRWAIRNNLKINLEQKYSDINNDLEKAKENLATSRNIFNNATFGEKFTSAGYTLNTGDKVKNLRDLTLFFKQQAKRDLETYSQSSGSRLLY